MRLASPTLASLAALLSLPLVACTDDPSLEGPPEVASGSDHTFVQTGWIMPGDPGVTFREVGFDLDEREDHGVDNQVGMMIGSLRALRLDLTAASTDAFARGEVVALHTIRADDLTDDDSVRWRLGAGVPTTTPPRFDGSDRFTAMVDTGELFGTIEDGRLAGAYGNVTIRVPFFAGQAPIAFALDDARIAVDLRGGGCTGKIGGRIPVADLRERLLPRLAEQVLTHMATHPDHDFTAAARDVFDRDDDGVVTSAEIVGVASRIMPADLRPDGASYDAAPIAISFGLGFRCAPATF